MKALHYYLGANTPHGFYSLYGNLRSAGRLYVLKGGAGCGKSTFMKKVAEKYWEEEIEYIHCSGDPQSLDAVYFPRFNAAIADGTAPHVAEPEYPGVRGGYINLGKAYDEKALRKYEREIVEQTKKYKAYYSEAYRFLAAWDALSEKNETDEETRKKAKIFSETEFRHKGSGNGNEKRIFLSGISFEGYKYIEGYDLNIERKITLKGSASQSFDFLRIVGNAARERGFDIICGASPLCPEHEDKLIIPELGIEICRSLYGEEQEKTVVLSDKPLPEIADAVFKQAVKALRLAKESHDELETMYNPFVNFNLVQEEAENFEF